MKKIWLISYNLEGVTAGPSVRFQRYAPFLEERGYRLVFVTLKKDSALADSENKEHFDIIRVSSKFKIFHHTLFLAKCFLKSIFSKEKPVTVLTFGITTFHLWLLPLIKLRGLKIVLVNTMSLDSIYLYGNSIWVKFYNKIHHFLYGILYRNINAIVNSSKELSSGFKRHGVPDKKLKIIYNGVNSKVFKPASEEDKHKFRQKLDLPSVGKIILFVGLKVERKGITDLIDSWKLYYKSHPDHYLVLVGDEKSGASDDAFNIQWNSIKDEISNPELRIINRPKHSQIEEYFFSSDVFIFLSKKEGMPNVVLEAMASGLPIILTEFEGFSDDYGINGEEYFLVDRNPVKISETLDRLTSSEDVYNKIKRNSLQKVQNDFLVESSIEKYIELFQ